MSKLLEQDIFAAVINQEVNIENLDKIGFPNGTGYDEYADCAEYIISSYDYYETEEFIDLFNLTEKIIEYWDYNGIDYRIYLYLKNNRIVGGNIFKYKETCSGPRPSGGQLTPSQQELRIANRIIKYIIEKPSVL